MNGRLGIIDWGIGGISVYKLIKERGPEVSVVYFSDTGVTPYGKMSRTELVARLNIVLGFLRSKGVTHLVIGCNAASTVIPYLDLQGLTIEGVIEAAVEMTAKLRPRRLGLIAGRRTVLSGVYRKAFAERGIEVEQRIAQPLSGLIESGDVSSGELRAECRRVLSPLKNCSHILLACTHYPAIAHIFREFVSPSTIFIDPAAELARRAGRWRLSDHGKDEFFTSGSLEAMRSSALTAFGCKLPNVRVEKLGAAVRK
ncbi:MAG: aspartate/glutamate racemase family protein [Chloracidobacterium sp.]|nr:aspartate/glutamate racemase family protein [Chloracidobacterium sp.]